MLAQIFKVEVLCDKRYNCAKEDCRREAVVLELVFAHHRRQQGIRHRKNNREYSCQIIESHKVGIVLFSVNIEVGQQKEQWLQIQSPKNGRYVILVGINDYNHDGNTNDCLHQNEDLLWKLVLLPHWIDDDAGAEEIISEAYHDPFARKTHSFYIYLCLFF